MFLGRHQILLLVAFAGTVLANIVPVLMSIDELDVLRSYTHRINVAGSIARSTTEVEKRLPPLARDIAALTSGLELSERTGALLSIENDIKQVSQALRILLPSYQAIVAEPEVRTLEAIPPLLEKSWSLLLAADDTSSAQAAHLRHLSDRTAEAVTVLAGIQAHAASHADALANQVYLHLSVTGALLLGAILIGFCINAFGSLSIFRALSREQEVNADLAQTKANLRERTEELSEAQRLGKLGDWRILRGQKTVHLGPETYELLRLPAHEAPTLDSLHDLVLEASRPSLARVHRSLVRSQNPIRLDIKMRRGDGSTGDFILSCKVLKGARNETLGLVGTLQDISERKVAEEQLQTIAYYDPLTGLANRTLFARELDKTLSGPEAEACTLLLLDLDRFKEVNDTLGHAAGDELLTRAAHAISRLLGTKHFLARLGGDEFAVIVRKIKDVDAIMQLAGEIVQALSGSFMLKQGVVTISTSIGIVMAPRNGLSASDLLRNADLALYKAKEEGRGRYAFFTADLDAMVQNKMALANDLRRAIATNTGLQVYFQPQHDLRTGRVDGFEALMRWHHATRGEVPPSEFIPVAESSSLICDLGIWILRESVRQAKTWLDSGAPPRSISVNVSPAQIWHSDFVSEVARVLEEFKLPPHMLCLELTESLMADHGEGRVRTALKALKKLGVTLALDDFGTDYSSLGYLAQLPFDKIKIDRIFVNGIDTSHRSRELLRGMIALGRGLGMEVIAEGAESEQEVSILRSLHCDLVQGYVFGKALPASLALSAANESDRAAPKDPPDRTDHYVLQLREALG